MNFNYTESTEAAGNAGIGAAAEPSGTVSSREAGRARRHLVSGWRFARHLLEMVVAMMIGMGALGAALATLGEPTGYDNLFVQYGLMDVSLSLPMVAWMLYRSHSWSEGDEMTVAMFLPTFALVVPVRLDVSRYVPDSPKSRS
jgi:hypothetical protein